MRLDITDAAELEALFTGLAFYGTGGGGSAQAGLALLQQAGLAPADIVFESLDALPDHAMVATGIIIGGRDPADPLDAGERARLGVAAVDLDLPTRFERAILALSAQLGRSIDAVVPVELGSLATAALLIATHRLGVPMLNADGTGRSIPELGMTKLDLAGLSPTPMALVDRLGGETLVARAPSAAMADRMARFVNRSVWGRGLACLAYPAPLARLRAGLVADSLGHALRIGRILCAGETASGRLEQAMALTGGTMLFEGTVAMRWRSEEPYAFREVDYALSGTGAFAGRRSKVWIKNEHHFVWVDDAMVAASPDPIAVLDATTLTPLTTLGEADGRRVVVVRVPVLDKLWNSLKGKALFGMDRMSL